jgi:MoaA/NifB/PqqE/SkfB family radical SAM enzyme
MTIETYKNALKFAVEYGHTISIGGGEPTLHPKFWEFLGLALGTQTEYLWLATNGSQTDTAIALAGLAKRGVLGVALSQDDYHDEIDYKVIEAFTKDKREHFGHNDNTPDAREIRNVTGNEIKAGRCKDGKIACPCEDLVIEPDGTIKGCGCKDSKIFGNVNTEVNLPKDYESGNCYGSGGQ